MGFSQTLIALLCFASCLFSSKIDRRLSYLVSKNRIHDAIKYYQKFGNEQNCDIAKFIEQISHKILTTSLHSEDPEEALISLFSHTLSKKALPLHILDKMISGNDGRMQAIALYLLSECFEDAAEPIIAKGLNSMFLPIRMQSLYFLAIRKSPIVVGQIESLKNLLPTEYEGIFSDLFGIQGTKDAVVKLKQHLTHKNESVKLSAIRTAAKFQFDELLPLIRSQLYDPSPRITESTLFTLGTIKDIEEKEKILSLLLSQNEVISLASLYCLGQLGISSDIMAEALKRLEEKHNLYLIANYSLFSKFFSL